MGSTPEEKTRIVRQDELDGTELAERIALFAVVTRHGRAGAVLEGLHDASRTVALRLLTTALAWSSAQRQARVTLEFGNRGDQHERLGQLMHEAHPVLRLAMCAQMAPHQLARFPQLANKEFRRIPGRDAFAARLVREASR